MQPAASDPHPAALTAQALVPAVTSRPRSSLLWWAAAGLLGAGLGLGAVIGRLTAATEIVVHHHARGVGPLPGCALDGAAHGRSGQAPAW